MNLHDKWIRYRWSVCAVLLGNLFAFKLWNEMLLPEWTRGMALRRTSDSLDALLGNLPQRKARWAQAQGQVQRVQGGLQGASVTDVQEIVRGSDLARGDFRIDTHDGTGLLPLSLQGGFLEIAELLTTLEKMGVQPMEWDMRPQTADAMDCKVILRLSVQEGAP